MSLYSFNKVFLIGRLGQTPEKQTSANGVVFCNFSIAIGQSYKNKDGQWQEKTLWFYVSAFGEIAERCCKYLKKGSLAHIEGSIDTYEKEKDGEKFTSYKIRASNIKPLDYKKNDNSTPEQTASDSMQNANLNNESDPSLGDIEMNEQEPSDEVKQQNAFRMDLPLEQ